MKTVIDPYKHYSVALILVLIVLTLSLSACNSSTPPAVMVDVPDKPTVIRTGMTPAVAIYEDDLNLCKQCFSACRYSALGEIAAN